MSHSCEHSGYHSAVGRYVAKEGQIRFVMVCDDCGGLMGDVTTVDYVPRFKSDGISRNEGQFRAIRPARGTAGV